MFIIQKIVTFFPFAMSNSFFLFVAELRQLLNYKRFTIVYEEWRKYYEIKNTESHKKDLTEKKQPPSEKVPNYDDIISLPL